MVCYFLLVKINKLKTSTLLSKNKSQTHCNDLISTNIENSSILRQKFIENPKPSKVGLFEEFRKALSFQKLINIPKHTLIILN